MREERRRSGLFEILLWSRGLMACDHRIRGRRLARCQQRYDLLELQRNEWSEVFLRVTPTGRMQLELRGGPYDAHVLTCEPLHE